MINRYRLCQSCSKRNQEKIAAFERARPGATVDDWVRFFDKNQDWQIQQQFNHCPQDFNDGFAIQEAA